MTTFALLMLIFSINFSRASDQCDCKKEEICLTEECILAASTVLSSLDKSADPCEDFYQFACGGWIQNAVSTNTDTFTMVDKRNQNDIRKMLEKVDPENDGNPELANSKAKYFYQSCMNVSEEQEKVNLANLLDIIDQVGGWHLTGSFYPQIDFDQRVGKLQHDFGVDVFFTWGVIEHEGANKLIVVAGGWNDVFGVEEDKSEYLRLMTMYTMLLKQAEQESVSLDLSDLVEPNATIKIEYQYEDISANEINTLTKRDSDYDSIIINALTNDTFMEPQADPNGDASSLFGLDNLPGFLQDTADNYAAIKAALSDVIQFEEALGNITNKPLDSTSLVSFKIAHLSQSFPFLDWNTFFHSAFSQVYNESILANDTEILIRENFLEGVHELVSSYENRPEVLENYMIWRVVASLYPNRPQEEYDRRESCLKQTEEVFSPVVTAMYIRSKGIDKSSLAVEQVTMMVKAMQEAFRENLNFIKWMSPDSATAAQAKLEHMADLIGYPGFVLNDTWLDLVYEDLRISSDHYLKNSAKTRSFARRIDLKKFSESPQRGLWNDFSHMANIATVNAFYNQVTNTMVVPIGMLQPPLFWSRPKSLTFGAFGIVVAHEITHAFDEVGIMYNSEGFFQPLYDNKTIEAFHNASNCIRQQYSEFSVAGVNVDGNFTMGENIADHGGLKIAEIAYENWLSLNNGQDTRLPALDSFSPFQLFYLGYALPWCADYSEAMLKTHVIKDEHAPDKFRVRGPLSNSHKFAETWGCSAESSMNPPDKCQIWG